MQVTRRFRATAALALALLAWGVVVAHPLPVLGGAVLGAWLLAAALQFLHELRTVQEHVAVDVRPLQSRGVPGTELPVAFTATLAEPVSRAVQVTLQRPASATAPTSDPRIGIPAGDRRADATVQFEWPVAGTYTLPAPRVSVGDADGLYETAFTAGDGSTVEVAARSPDRMHVGAGGERLAAELGDHPTEGTGSGLNPREIRQYLPGDPANRIDWRATARLDEPYVREFEVETDRRTLLLLDTRASLHTGRPGETPLEYLRQVALAFVDSAREHADPLGAYLVSTEGIRAGVEPRASAATYERVDTLLRNTTPEEATTRRDVGPKRDVLPPVLAREAATHLEADSAFGRTLRPFFTQLEHYHDQIRGDPLYGTVQRALDRVQGTVWTVLLTDDTARSETVETVKRARRANNHVLVFLAPRALYRPGSLGELEAAYAAYRDFETFRQRLERLDRVTTFEVAPSDRIEAVLASGRGRSRQSEARNA